MTKKVLAVLLCITFIVPSAKAEEPKPPTLAILDTALDTSLPIIKKSLVYEACVLEWESCPNGSSLQEGPGSSSIQFDWITKNGFSHGTQMASLAAITDPNVKIVFVRIVGTNSNGTRQPTSELTVLNALSWVIENKERLNIQAVSMSQGRHNLTNYKDYCPQYPDTVAKINELYSMGVPVFLPAGNLADHYRISWPACITQAISISSSLANRKVPAFTNYDSERTDFFALGVTNTFMPGGKLVNIFGTSASTVIAATNWVTIKSNKPNLSYSEIYNLISRTALPTRSSKAVGKIINIKGALNE